MEALNQILFALSLIAPSTTDPATLVKSDNVEVAGPTKEVAKEVLSAAEAIRKKLAIEWFGRELPRGVGYCAITVELSDQEQRCATWQMERDGCTYQLVRLKAPRADLAGSPLVHEILHVLTNSQFPQGLPAWANEGVACVAEDKEEFYCRRAVAWFSKTGNWPRLKEILEAEHISENEHKRYWAAASLTRYLLVRGDRQMFFQFASAGKSDGWNNALRRYYAVQDVNDLEKSWQAWAVEGLQRETKPLVPSGMAPNEQRVSTVPAN